MFSLGKYKNLNNILPGKYQNYDSSINRFSIQVINDGLLINFGPVNTQISRSIYFSPVGFPVLDRKNCMMGSAYDGWCIPTSAYIFTVTDADIEISLAEPSITFDEYYSLVRYTLRNNILDIYATNQIVTLFYSGGVDSMTILSTIMSLNLLHRTRLVYIKNLTQPDASYLSHFRISAISDTLSVLRSKAHSVEIHEISESDIATLANDSTVFQMIAYCTTIVMRRIGNGPFILGDRGNETLLHSPRLINEILLTNKDYSLLNNAKLRSDLYSLGSAKYSAANLENIPSPHNSYLVTKLYQPLNRTPYGNLFCPLADYKLVKALRTLDFKTVTFDTILTASVGFNLIQDNVPDMFKQHTLLTEHSVDIDNINNIFLPTSILNLEMFSIPDMLNHNSDGLRFLNEQRDEICSSKTINLNSIISIKTLQYMSLC